VLQAIDVAMPAIEVASIGTAPVAPRRAGPITSGR
jgi:hypothetical protein